MTPSHWLAALVLAWTVGAGVWQAVDKPVERYYRSFFYMLVTSSIESAIILLSLSILSAPVWVMVAGVILVALSIIGVFYKIHTGDREL